MLMLVSAALLLWAFAGPLSLDAPTPSDRLVDPTRIASASNLPALSEFDVLSKLELRQQLEPNAPVAAPVFPIKLIGTILEPGQNLALFQDKEGVVSFKGEGEVIASAEVRRVGEQEVTIFYAGQELKLKVEGEKRP
jgi:hypothetical protein